MSILKDAPQGAQVLDLPGARAARAEARAAAGAPAGYLHLAVGYVETKAEVPLSSLEDFDSGAIKAGLTALLADPADVGVVLEDGLTTDDLSAIMRFITGLDSGESKASPAS